MRCLSGALDVRSHAAAAGAALSEAEAMEASAGAVFACALVQ